MIVKITYSSELEEVPSEVSKLLQDVEKQLTALAKKLPGKDLAEQEPDIKSAISRLEHSMSGLEKLEAKVKDCHAILVGFLGVKEKKESTQSESTQETDKKGKEK